MVRGVVDLITYENCQIYEKVLLELVPEARISIKLASANIRNFRVKILTDSFPLSEYIKHFIKKGVSVKILTTPNACKSAFVTELLGTRNFEVKACARNHMKLVVVDSRRAYIGSANLTSSGLGTRKASVRNFEIGFITQSKSLLTTVRRIFDDVWSGRLCDGCLYRDRTDVNCTYPR